MNSIINLNDSKTICCTIKVLIKLKSSFTAIAEVNDFIHDNLEVREKIHKGWNAFVIFNFDDLVAVNMNLSTKIVAKISHAVCWL